MANRNYLFKMIAFLAACGGIVAVLWEKIEAALVTNPLLNGLICAVMLFGILYNLRRTIALSPDVIWLSDMSRGAQPSASPRLLGSVARMMENHRGHLSLTTVSMRSLADGVGNRLQDGREVSRYIIGLLIFLGLLGTFWGLLGTISSIADLVAAFDTAGSPTVEQAISNLRNGLERPLSDMGTAFSSSLLGLAGSLIVGFLDLQSGQAQSRFFNSLEDWLSDITRLSGRSSDEDAVSTAYLATLLEQVASSMLDMKDVLTRGEMQRQSTESTQVNIMQALELSTDLNKDLSTGVKALVDAQTDLKNSLIFLTGRLDVAELKLDDATREHIRNSEVLLRQILQEGQAGRDQTLAELRDDLRLLARAVAALADSRGTTQPSSVSKNSTAK